MSKGLPRSMSRGDAQRQEIIKQTIPLRDFAVTVSATGAAIGFGSAPISGLPEGNVLFLGAVASNIVVSGSGADANLSDTFNGDFSIGTTPADDATITGADVDIIPSTALPAATAEVGVATRASHSAAVTGTVYNNTAADLELNFNVLVDAADIVDDESVDLTVNGVVTVAYIMLGDD